MRKELMLIMAVFVIKVAAAQTQRMVLYEGFTNVGCAPCANQNPDINVLLQSNEHKVVAIKYHTSGPGSDILNIQSQPHVTPRVQYYNITTVPSRRLDGINTTFNQTNIDTRYNTPSPFFLELNHIFNDACDTVTIVCIIKAAQNFTSSNMVLQLGMVEKSIVFDIPPGTNGETSFTNVMRRMIPNSNGTSLKNTWIDGESDTITFEYAVPKYIYDLNELAFVAFIQANTDKAVQQAACSQTIPLNDYVKLTANNIPYTPICSSELSIEIKVKNLGNTVVSSFDIEAGITGDTSFIVPWSGNLAQGQEEIITLPVLSLTSSSPEIFVNILNPNGQDNYPTLHNSLKQTLNYVVVYEQPPLLETFTDVNFPPQNWTSITYDEAAYWHRSSLGGFGSSPGGSACLNFYNSPAGEKDYLYVSALDFSGMSSVEMTFSVAYARYNASYSDRLRVQISTNCGNSWADVYNKAGSTLATAPDFSSGPFEPNASQWRKEIINLNAYAGQNNIMLRFYGLSGYGNYVYVDDVTFGPSTASINENDNTAYITVYPNPVNRDFNIEFLLLNTSDVIIDIYDNMGRKIDSRINKKLNQGNHSIHTDASTWSAGVYFVVLTTGSDIKTYKLIKH